MRRCAIIFLVCLFAGLDVQAGKEYLAKPGDEVVANEFIVHLMAGASVDTLLAKYLPGTQIQTSAHERFVRIRVPGGLPSGISARIAADLQVDFVEPNRIRHAQAAAPNDPNYASSWWFPAVQALQAWSLLPGQYLTAATAGTARVKVAVLDTGADCTHPDFINTGGSSTNSAQGGQLMFSASQAIVATNIVNPVCPWQDDHGHGTHVTGILAAATSNGIGVSGLGYPVQVIEIKVLDSTGSGNDFNISTGIRAAADAGAQVISLSLGEVAYSQTLQNAVNYAWQRNALVVAAAGNDTSSELFFPAGANHAVGVSATDSGNNPAWFTNFGNSVQLAAPGDGIVSTAPTYPGTSQGWLSYVTLSGTSMATPFVSGLAGLVAMSTPNATAAAILQRMEQTANSITTGGGWDQHFGFGIINASGAVSGSLRAAANGAIAGQIINSFASAVNGAQITINGQTITTDTSGLYRFGTLPAGTYAVSVSATGFATQSLSATVAPGADTSFTVTMGVTYGKFIGTVTDQGLGVSGAIVQTLSGGLINAVAVADQNGQYTLWVPGSGTYDVRASQIGRVTTTLTALTLSAGGTTTANLTLPRMGTIAGSVRDASLNPIANAQVLLTGGSFSAAATTDANGNYSLIGIPAGSSYSATATAAGFQASTQTGIVVSADVTTNVTFTMTSSIVAAPTFNPPAGAYGSPQSVAISTTTAGASIRYTTDGSAPTSSVGTLYNSGTPVSVSSSLTLKAIAYKAGMTDSAVVSAGYVITASGGNSAGFVKTDTTTYGSWKGVYGSNGYNVFDDTVSYPGYVTVTPTGQLNYIWGSSVSDLRATQKALSPTDRIAATWYTSASYTIDLNFNDGAQHQLAVYSLDWDAGGGRRQTLSILDGATNAVLDSQIVSTFQNGTYVVWNLTGHVILRVTNTGSINATISGLFFDPANAGSTVATPTFNPPAGNYSSAQSVTISTTTPGASIRYTTDGSTPSSTVGTAYSGSVAVSSNLTLKAIAYKAGMSDSPVASGAYTIQAATPTFNPPAGNYSSAQSVTIGTTTAGASIHYTIDGSTPSSTVGLAYSGPVSVGSNLTLKAVAYGAGLTDSAVSSAAYTITIQAATPTFNPPAGNYSSAQSVTISTTTAGASIHYTIDGSTPSSTVGLAYSGPVSVGSSLTLKAIAYGAGLTDSAVSSAAYTISIQASAPTFNPPAGNYSSAQSVTIGTTTAGASIHYTIDGSTPSSTVGLAYSGPVSVGSSLTLKAVAYGAGLTDSAVSSAAYTISIQASAPTFNPPAGSYGPPQSVTISTTTGGASIHYTTDGSTPSSTVGIVYSGPVSVNSNLTLKAIAYGPGLTDSAVASGTYTITGPIPVPMSQYNFDRTGANLSEFVLNTSNVNPAQFGKLFSRTVDDSVYGLPLIIPSLSIAGGVHDVLFVATMSNSVYAFDAVDPAHTQPYWSVNLGTPDVGNSTTGPVNFGILGTPFIDAATNTIYVVAKVRNSTDVGLYIFALDITTGQTKYNSPRRMSFTFPVEGVTLTNVGGAIQRAGLLVSNGILYVAVANILPGDQSSQEGFVQSFDAHNLSSQLGTFQATPSATEGKGGIWEAGRGLPVDASGVYFSVAGGAYSSAANPPNLGSSIVKVAPSTLNTQDWFAPQNWQYLSDNNLDPAGGGVTLIPGTSLLFAGGKEGVIYLLNRNNMGHLEGTDGQPVQRFQASFGCAQNTAAPDCSQTLGTSYWDRGGSGMLYVWDKTDVLRAYPFNGQTFNTATPQVGALAVGMTGGPSLSANGADLSSAIVWAVTTTNTDSSTPGAGTLRAYRADNITQELYNSDVNQIADSVGTLTKFAPPVVANGRVYIATQSNMVQVYGLVSAGGPASQTITFAPLADKTIGVAPFTITANASSGLPVSFNSLTAAVCSVAGNSVTIVAIGTCSIRATEPGNAIYSPASPVTQSFTVNAASQVATPTFNPPAGAYGSSQSVTISTATAGASIHYTTDGSTPSSTVGTAYSGSIAVSSNVTLKAIAYKAGMSDSLVATAAYTIQVATPIFNPPAGNYSSAQSVTISTTTAGASIRYTTDGTLPTSSVGTLYNNTPVSVSSSLTLKAIAYKAGMADSAAASAGYVVTAGGGNSAAFVKIDATTFGSWKGVYGSNGYNVFDDTVSYPGYVTVTPAGQLNYVWNSSVSDLRATQKALSPTDRLAATWYTSGTFTIDLNFNDGAQHQLAVYSLDWDSGGGRRQTLSILDGATNAVLDSQIVGTYQNGKYAVWNLTGHVILRVSNSGSVNATISGLFFDPVNSGASVATPSSLP